ncbi:MAG: pentapeptide repeat-containing protein [Leptolyngbyaceae cyanobacterium MAG.088]|nr:pentapeptide repeat-containing protein [Leptolyngbyaceae cyanobacterium MAG.088]
MSAQEPFDRADLSADSMSQPTPQPTPQSIEASERFTVDYNPDPDFAPLVESSSEPVTVMPAGSPMKVSVQLLIAIASTLITLLGLGLDSFWLIFFGSLIALAISIRLAMPTMRAITNDLSPEQRSLIIAIPGLVLGVYGLMQVSGINASLLRWGATREWEWEAIGALGDFLGALGQIFIAVLALYVAWRQFIISRDLTTQQNLITQQQTIDAYFQGISELVLDDEGLLEDWPQERIIAEARTAAILGGIDGDGKAKVLRFLSRSKLLTPLARDQRLGRPILDGSGGYAEDRLNGTRVIDIGVMLAAADISGNDLRWVDLSGINLIRSNLAQCALVRTDFTRTVLCDADLSGADLMGTRFFYGAPDVATPRTRNDIPSYETGEFTGAVVEGVDLSNVQRLSEDQRCYLCAWGGSKTRATIPGGCRDIPNRLGR